MENKFAEARKVMGENFSDDAGLLYGYVSNIAMLLHDRYGIKDFQERNKAALAIMNLVFDIKKKDIKLDTSTRMEIENLKLQEKE